VSITNLQLKLKGREANKYGTEIECQQNNRIMRTRRHTTDGLVPDELHLGLVRLCSGSSMGCRR
jgi:hypothetical protein